MITVQFVEVHDEQEDKILEKASFKNATGMHDPIVSQYVYEHVLALDIQYDFAAIEDDSPYIEIQYFQDGNLVYIDNCTDYVYNL